jgi:cob(I)alamin adenosyltransferase
MYTRKEQTGTPTGAKRLGLFHLCYGPGVGKTTRVIGLAVRAAGEGLRVDFVQFMKSGDSGEVSVFKGIPNIRYYCPGPHSFILERGPEPAHYSHAATALQHALEAAKGDTDLLVCDEILDTLFFGTLTVSLVTGLIHLCKGRVELIMTGRSAPPEILALADYATEFVMIKHPYEQGIRARKGIEY